MLRDAISANPQHYVFKIFRGSMPSESPKRPKISFLAIASLQKFFKGRLPTLKKNPR